jgi:hypothetical protein
LVRVALGAALLVGLFAPGGGATAGAGAVATGPSDAGADSVELYDEILSQGAANDEAEAAAIAGELGASPARRGPAAAAPASRLRLDFETVAGYRVSQRLSARWRTAGGTSAGLAGRRDGRRVGGYAEVRRAWFLERLVWGGLRPRFGEGLVLGVRYVPFASPRSAAAEAVSPTTSLWGQKTGAAATARLGRHRVSAASWRGSDGASLTWGFWTVQGASGAVGAAVGHGGLGHGTNATVCAQRKAGGLTVAGELALVRGRVFGVCHVLAGAGGAWNVTVFDAPTPSGFSAGVAAPGDESRRQSGAALHHTGTWRGAATRVTVYGSARRFDGTVERRRKIDASVRGRTGGVEGAWNLALQLSERSDSEPADEVIRYRPQHRLSRECRFRCGWTGGGRSALRQQYRLVVRVDGEGRTSVVGTLGWRLELGTVDGFCQVSNYEVGSGLTGYVIQPGLPGPDAVSAVSRKGTDITARIRVRLSGARLGLYWSRRWDKKARWYVTAGARL